MRASSSITIRFKLLQISLIFEASDVTVDFAVAYYVRLLLLVPPSEPGL